MNRSELALAVFLSVVPGFGVALYATQVVGDPTDPVVAGTSIATTIGIFLLVLASAGLGSTDDDVSPKIKG